MNALSNLRLVSYAMSILLLFPVAAQMTYSSSDELSSYFSDFLVADASQGTSYYSGISHLPGTSYQGISFEEERSQDKGLMPAPGYYGQAISRPTRSAGSSPNEFRISIPYTMSESGQVRSDGAISTYPNAGARGGTGAQAFLSFDISEIPRDALIRNVAIEFQGWDVVGSPFFKLGCLNLYPASYSMLGPHCYSRSTGGPACLRVCSSAELYTPRSSSELAQALQSSLGQPRFQLRLQFDRSAAVMETGSTMMITKRYSTGDGLSTNVRYSLQSPDFSHGKYYILSPGVNLSEFGITQEMLEKAIDVSRVKISRQEEGADCMKDGVWGKMHCPAGPGTCYCVISEPTTSEIPSGVDWLGSGIQSTTYYTVQPTVDENFIRFGVVSLIVTCSLPQAHPPVCDQQACQAQSRAMGSAYSKGGKTYQEYSECNCVDNTCRCTIVEREIGQDRGTLPQPMVIVPGLGSASFRPPKRESLIKTSEWGEVPANQVLIVLKDVGDLRDLEELARILNGQVVGYIDFIDLYQIETDGKSEVDLRDALSKAAAYSEVMMVSPHQQIYLEKSPLDDPVYGDRRMDSYGMVGVQRAWNQIEDSGIGISEVHVGVVDDGLYRGFGEFSSAVRTKTTEPGAELIKPLPEQNYPRNISGSHGTGIMNILAADPDNGGLVGIASKPLGRNLNIEMINIVSSPKYTECPGNLWVLGCLSALMQEIGNESTILSCSWGRSDATELEVYAFRNFARMVSDDILFVCSAGNDAEEIDGSLRFPCGHNLSNVITVGSVLNNGKLFNSNKASDNFEISLAAPGEQAVWGVNDEGRIICQGNNIEEFGGTSMAVPYVTAAAALVRSLDPSLNASEIKAILVETARTRIKTEVVEIDAPNDVGGRILAIDLAVETTINRLDGTPL